VISSLAFTDDKKARHDADGWCEAWFESSVNWDDAGVLDHTWTARTSGGSRQSEYGVAAVERAVIEKSGPVRKGNLRYERAALSGNQFHGNLLFHKDLQPIQRRQIAGLIAEEAEWLPRDFA
jgi:hypothetical protein